VCSRPQSYLFWDGIHPTSSAHALLGEAMLRAALVPEPATLALMVLGLCMLAWRTSRRGRGVLPTFAHQ
jgi:phospholipase/lecithinase/hemolysin